MNPSSSTIVALLSLLLVSLSTVLEMGEAVITLPNNLTVSAVYAFGDSIVDTGNNNHLATIIKCNFPPYGRDFKGGLPTGRFCNGKTPGDLLVEQLGVKELLPAYLDPNLTPEELLTGVCFASGASGYDPLTAQTTNVLGLSDQISMFEEYIMKLKAMVGEEKASSILTNSFSAVVTGSDDIANTYFSTPLRKHKYDISSYTDLMVQGATSFVQELYDLGARRIAVFSVPPVGCVPFQRTLHEALKGRPCYEDENQAALLFNSKLSPAIDNFNKKYPDMRAVYVDVYNSLLDIINNPHSYGFEEATKGCCGTGNVEVVILCNKLSPGTCPNVSKYVFWDSYHPTQKTYKILIDRILPNYLNKLF